MGDSYVFAGYQTGVTTGSATSSAAQFKVPALSCTSAYRGIAPGAGVQVNGEETFSSASVFVGCPSGKAVYFPSLAINGASTDYTTTPLAAGDVVKVFTKVTTAATTVRVTDVTKGITKKLTGPGASPDAAYIGDSGWYLGDGFAGPPRFGSVDFTNCLVDGKALASWNPYGFQRVNHKNVVLIALGALSPPGTAFSTTYYKGL